MRISVPLLAAAATALMVAASACSGSSKTSSPTLASGPYLYTASAAPDDLCWPASNVFPPVGIGLGFSLSATSSVGDATFTLTPAANVAPILPAMTGLRTANAIFTTGAGATLVTSGCTLAVSARGLGLVTADGRLTLDFTTSISADTIASNGQPSNCAALQDTSFSGIPFPSLTPATNGTCSYGLTGVLEKT